MSELVSYIATKKKLEELERENSALRTENRQLKEKVAELEKADLGQWISVKDRLPENDLERVLVILGFEESKTIFGEPKIDTDRFTDAHWVRWNDAVTHWMTLPAAPAPE